MASTDVIELRSGRINHRVLGPADGRPVVFVHGALVDGTLWRDVDHRLADRGLRTYAPDLPLGSHRLPMPDDADLTPVGQARRVLDYLERLDLHGVTLVANDTGGAVTQLLLASGEPAVDRVGGVVFTNCDTVGRFPPPPFDRMFGLAVRPRLSKLLMQPMRSARLRAGRLAYGPLCGTPLDDELTWGWIGPSVTDLAIDRDFARLVRGIDAQQQDLADATELLGSFERPVLAVWGLDDPFFRLEDGRELAGRFPRSRFVEVPDSRAFVPHDQPVRLAEEIAAFVDAEVGRPDVDGADGDGADGDRSGTNGQGAGGITKQRSVS